MGKVKHAIVCDFDGTLLNVDSLHEAAVRCLISSPLNFVVAFHSLITKGRLAFKLQLEDYYAQDYSNCVDNAVLSYLQDKGHNYDLYIFSGCPETKLRKYASRILQDRAVTIKGSTSTNFVGHTKAKEISNIQADKIVYIGNSSADIACWDIADEKLFAGKHKEWVKIQKSTQNKIEVLNIKNSAGINIYLQQLRIYQWVKNILVFTPVLLSANLETHAWILTTLSFFLMSFVASGTYIINDIRDIDKDRQHPRKKFRPIARGQIDPTVAIAISIILIAIGVAGGFMINLLTGLAICSYVTLTLFYSFVLKSRLAINFIALSILFCLRVLVGGYASSVEVTDVFLSFSFLVFSSLAVMKRVSDLLQNIQSQNYKGYITTDISVLTNIGVGLTTSSFILLLYYVLDSFSNDINRSIALAILPVYLYWFSNCWIATTRGEMTDDPIVHSLTNWKSRLALGIMFVLFLLAHAANKFPLE